MKFLLLISLPHETNEQLFMLIKEPIACLNSRTASCSFVNPKCSKNLMMEKLFRDCLANRVSLQLRHFL